VPTDQVEKRREAFIDDLVKSNFTTFFAVTHPKYATGNKAYRFTPSPVSPALPHAWSYREARERLFALGELLTVEEAERRNINFVNPALRDYMPAALLPTLRGGIQLLLPGERAYTHRHSANAFRFVLEAPDEGAYTVVDGVKIPMRPGDLVLTPNWTWHDHHNDSDAHAIWYDGLDVLMAYFVGGVFSEEFKGPGGDAYRPAERSATPTGDRYYYPYAMARQTLERLYRDKAGNAFDGVLMEYLDPVTSGPTFPSMNTVLRLVPPKSTLQPKPRTENIVFITVEGSVTFRLPDRTVRTERGDVTAIPSWVTYSIVNDEKEPAVLFSNSDRPLFEALGFYREADA
jgi:gentisate 1,2-dioxygenase